MKPDCEMKCDRRTPCDHCGWNPVEATRRKDYIDQHGLTKKVDMSRGLVLKEMRGSDRVK